MTNYTTHDTHLYTNHGLTRHENGKLILRDSLDEHSQAELRAMVASGEYFSSLASLLDQILDASGEACQHPELYKIISELLYMQQHYKISKQ